MRKRRFCIHRERTMISESRVHQRRHVQFQGAPALNFRYTCAKMNDMGTQTGDRRKAVGHWFMVKTRSKK